MCRSPALCGLCLPLARQTQPTQRSPLASLAPPAAAPPSCGVRPYGAGLFLGSRLVLRAENPHAVIAGSKPVKHSYRLMNLQQPLYGGERLRQSYGQPRLFVGYRLVLRAQLAVMPRGLNDRPPCPKA